MGKVLSLDEQVEVPFGHWNRTLMTKDFTPLEPRGDKFYARGVGPVLTLAVSGSNGREELIRSVADVVQARLDPVQPLGDPVELVRDRVAAASREAPPGGLHERGRDRGGHHAEEADPGDHHDRPDHAGRSVRRAGRRRRSRRS